MTISDLTGGPSRTSRDPVARAKVVRAPSGPNMPMTVTLLNYSNRFGYDVEPDHWIPKGITLPEVNDMALVLFDDYGDIWVVGWEGYFALFDQDTLDALQGTIGTPSNLNRFVTDEDPRMEDARTPTAHTHPIAEIVGTALGTGEIPLWNGTSWEAADLEEEFASVHSETITGDAVETEWTINHNLGTDDVFVLVREDFGDYEHVNVATRALTGGSTVVLETLPPLGNGDEYVVTVARAIGGATVPVSTPAAHSSSHGVAGSDPLPDRSVRSRMVLLDEQHIEGQDENYSGNISAAAWTYYVDSSDTIPLKLEYTAEVDCWWEVTFQVGIVQKVDGNYHYSYGLVKLGPTSDGFPAITGHVARVANDAVGHDLQTQHGGVNNFASRKVTRRYPVAAGDFNELWFVGSGSGGTWNYYKGGAHMWAEGKVYAR